MAKKAKTVYVCTECGYDTSKWIGRCPECGEWNTMKEMTIRPEHPSQASLPSIGFGDASGGSRIVKLSEVSAIPQPRIDTGDAELNRVLGGGLVLGSLTLLGGEPGIGKSTLLLQTVLSLKSHRVLYVSGEESENQIKMRADRLSPSGGQGTVFLACETQLERIYDHIREAKPGIVVIDSIQTIFTATAESTPGSITQIRECTAGLQRLAKQTGIPVILIGHITKDGSIAGPKVLEHIVDTVIQFEGDRHYYYRILRSIKNRFGSTAELGIYEMRSDGLRAVDNPSGLLLSQASAELSGIAIAAAVEGARTFLIETQALISTAAYGTPQHSSTGFDNRRLNMLLAVLEKRVGFKLAQKDVFLNIAGGLRVSDPAIDLSVIAAVLSSNVDTPIDRSVCLTGEVGLSGEIRPVARIEQRIAEAGKLGFTRILIPEANRQAAARAAGTVELLPVARVEHALRALFG